MSLLTNPGFSNALLDDRRKQVLSVIIVTWNVSDFLRGCLKSLQDTGVPSWAEIVVVDNNSSDNTVSMVTQEFPWARLIEAGANLGFSRANNLAIPETTGEFVLLLNPDTIVFPDALERLVKKASENPDAGALGPKQLGRSGEVCYEGAVAIPTVWNVCCDFFRLARLFPKSKLFNGRLIGDWDHESDRDVPGVPGTAMLLRRTALSEAGLLDEHMHYVEDMDLCVRLRQRGWKILYVASSVILHYGGESSKKIGNNSKLLQIAFQSFWFFLCKHRSAFTAIWLSVAVFLWSLAVICAALPLSLMPSARVRSAEWIQLGAGMFRWSISRKEDFEHHLAIPIRSKRG